MNEIEQSSTPTNGGHCVKMSKFASLVFSGGAPPSAVGPSLCRRSLFLQQNPSQPLLRLCLRYVYVYVYVYATSTSTSTSTSMHTSTSASASASASLRTHFLRKYHYELISQSRFSSFGILSRLC